MRLPIDLYTLLPDPCREIRTLAAEIADDLVWSYRVARESTSREHRRAEIRYNQRVVKKQDKAGPFLRVQLHAHSAGVPSKLAPKYSGLCEVLEVRGPTMTLCELDSRKVFKASNDALRPSTL